MNVTTPLIQTSPIATTSKHFLSILGNRSPIKPFALAFFVLLGMPLESMAVSTSPTTLAFSAVQGSTPPPAQAITFWKGGDRTRSWSVSAKDPWLAVTPTSGTISTEQDQIAVSVTPTGLAAGAYSSSVTITTESLKGRVAKTSIPVTLTVQTNSSTTGFLVSPPSLQYSGIVGGPNVTAGVTITNTSAAPLTVTWHDNINWLVATSGDTVTMPPGGSATISHTASTASLWAGNFAGVATVTGGGITKQIPVSIVVVQAESTTPALSLTPATLSFSGTVGTTNPTAKTISVSNTGSGTLTWTAGDNAAWLTLTPASGTNTGTITASVNLAGLAAGTYNGTITVAATGASSKSLPVSLSVNPSATTASTATLTWTTNTETDLAGYRIYMGTQSGAYNPPISVGKVTTYQVTNLSKGTTYFFTITAMDTAGNESSPSPEVSKSIF